jgi:DNA invertase Pin-like site-specific DNA recombinase
MQITRIPAQRENRKTRIAVYCRVSTKLEEQEESLETQRAAYTDLISLRSDWELVGIYSDSLSGLSAEKRPEFMRMIDEAMAGNIDRILCKSVSRFSRNVAECKKYADLLRTRNVTVEFEKENLRTDDPTSSFIFSLMAAIAENESRSISENIRWGYQERFKRGEFNLGNNRILGYDTVNKKLVPNKDADIIRLIYTLFLQGINVEEIIRKLTDVGVKTRNGTPLSRTGILYILGNETYVGDKKLHKQPPRNFITKKPDPTIPFESKYLENDHEAIVSRSVWDAVQKKLKQNKELTEVVGHRGGQPHFLYGKVFCGECGAPMTRRTVNGPGGGRIKIWVCREKRKGSGCKGRNVKEEELLKFGDAARIVVKDDGIEIL